MRTPEYLLTHESRILKALRTATNRAVRSNDIIRNLFASATVRSEAEPDLKVIVTFTAAPFRGGLHQIYDSSYIERASDRELAGVLAWSLRQSTREKLTHRNRRLTSTLNCNSGEMRIVLTRVRRE